MTRFVDRTRMTTTKSIAVIAPNWLGDAVMSLPLVGMLGAADATVALVAPASTARVYRGMPEVDELAVLPKRTFTRGMGPRARYLARTKPGAVVLLPPSLSSAVGPWLARVGIRVGYRADGRSAFLSRGAFDAAQSRNEHLSGNYLRLGEAALAALGIAVPAAFEPPPVRVSRQEHAELDALFEPARAGRPFAVVVPGATYGPAKSWPWERYRETVRVLAGRVPVALAGTAAEREMCAAICAGVDNVTNLAGETPLGAFLSLLSRAAVVLANDSGSPHLAASMGTPVVVLFGSTSPEWTAPLGPSVDVIRHPVACSPCFRKTCPTQLECFDGITVEGVLAAVEGYL